MRYSTPTRNYANSPAYSSNISRTSSGSPSETLTNYYQVKNHLHQKRSVLNQLRQSNTFVVSPSTSYDEDGSEVDSMDRSPYKLPSVHSTGRLSLEVERKRRKKDAALSKLKDLMSVTSRSLTASTAATASTMQGDTTDNDSGVEGRTIIVPRMSRSESNEEMHDLDSKDSMEEKNSDDWSNSNGRVKVFDNYIIYNV